MKELMAVVVAVWLGLAAVVVLGTAVVADQHQPCAQGGSGRQVSGVQLSTEQLANATTIVDTTRQSGMPEYAAVVAIATAMQESTLHNSLTYDDHDSLGLFQQRVSIYGRDTAIDPVKSTRAFLAKLARIPGWQTMPLTQAAQAVQISAFPNAYAKWASFAEALVAQLWPPGTGAGTGTCTGSQGNAALGGSITGRPLGYQPPTTGRGAIAVGFALRQLGKPYRWDTAGPDSYDCSGLVVAAWAAAGVSLPHSTYEQVHQGQAVPGLASLIPGDLIFIAGSDGTNSNPGHVGMYIGFAHGVPWLIQAPEDGKTVECDPVATWSGLIVAIRRPASG